MTNRTDICTNCYHYETPEDTKKRFTVNGWGVADTDMGLCHIAPEHTWHPPNDWCSQYRHRKFLPDLPEIIIESEKEPQ